MSGRESAMALGEMFGAGLFIILPVAIGYWWAKRLTARREEYAPVRWPIAVGFVISVLALAGQCSNPRAIDEQRKVEALRG